MRSRYFFSKPGHYIGQLVAPTLALGAFMTVVSWLYVHSPWYATVTIPIGLHSLIGIVIGLLLVFRTNTAYDRWWEGRRSLADLAGLMATGALAAGGDGGVVAASEAHLSTLGDYLLSPDGDPELRSHLAAAGALRESMRAAGVFPQTVDRHMTKVLAVTCNLERIKSTPIPLSYALHIKASVLVYLASLPFGMFHDQGLWAVPMVMLVFYIVAGIEIISNEIEDPFHGDPNDLPVREHLRFASTAMGCALRGATPITPQPPHK